MITAAWQAVDIATATAGSSHARGAARVVVGMKPVCTRARNVLARCGLLVPKLIEKI